MDIIKMRVFFQLVVKQDQAQRISITVFVNATRPLEELFRSYSEQTVQGFESRNLSLPKVLHLPKS
jgi:hypothetical protein